MTSDPLNIQCTNPACGARLKLPAALAGKKARCPRCQQVFVVEHSGGAPAAASRAPVFQAVPGWIAWISQPRPRTRTALRYTLLASLALHMIAAPLAPDNGLTAEQLNNLETEYGKKISAAKTAGVVAKRLEGKITMPPPPPDPEGVVSSTLTQTLTHDIEKVVGTLDMRMAEVLKTQVAISLKDELAAAAKQIAEGKLTEKEIDDLHQKFKKKAQETAVTALRDERVRTQVETAKLTTTEWYESNIAPMLFKNIDYILFFTQPGGGGPVLWSSVFCSYNGWYRWREWRGISSHGHLAGKLDALDLLAHGAKRRYVDPADRKLKYEPIGAPSKLTAAHIAGGLRAIYKGNIRPQGDYPTPSWKNVVFGELDQKEFSGMIRYSRMTGGVLNEFLPHRDEMRETAEKAEELWEGALKAADAFVSGAESSLSEAELQRAQDACVKQIAELHKKCVELVPGDAGFQKSVLAANWALVVETLTGPEREKGYKFWVDELVSGLEPLIRDFAQGQFKKGIIVHKDGVDQALKEFTAQIVPLLRRDTEKLIPKAIFDKLVFSGTRRYKSKVTGEAMDLPGADDIKAENETLVRLQSDPVLKAYIDKRRVLVEQDFKQALDDLKEEVLAYVTTGNLLLKNLGEFAEGADYADKVQEKLTARDSALRGRGQDLANLTADGVPDTSAALFALKYGGGKGHGANLMPELTQMEPSYITRGHASHALRSFPPSIPPAPAKAGFETQAEPKAAFKSARLEGIPFLPKFPKLDGDLSDWGKIRPLVLKAAKGQEPILVYAAWNYQGFFFGYRVAQPAERFYYPSQHRVVFNTQSNTLGGNTHRQEGIDWATSGDHLRLFFDTLDARNTNRGELHGQEFIILPLGSDSDATQPGCEKIISSQRDAKSKEWRGVKSTGKVFLSQPSAEHGPDGTGPYRMTKADKDGYTTEVFLPRTLFNVPVFAPGWFVGFECAVATGFQKSGQFAGQTWAGGNGTNPATWGDFLLLGSDPRVVIQEADGSSDQTQGIVPGHSYLLTVRDPDRNVNLSLEDTVLVSAEVVGGRNDVEVFILKETEKNSGLFRGYVNTQPGAGREVQGVLEVMCGQEIHFGYVDFANARGERNVMTMAKLPVVSSLMTGKLSEPDAK